MKHTRWKEKNRPGLLWEYVEYIEKILAVEGDNYDALEHLLDFYEWSRIEYNKEKIKSRTY